MFWQFNYQSSEIENLLNKEEVTLLEILNEDDVLQECKAQNKKLIDFLATDENITALVDFVVDEPDQSLDEKLKYKLPVRACEILTSNVVQLNDGVANNPDRLRKLLMFLKGEEALNPLQTSLFAKLFEHLASQRTEQILELMTTEVGLLGSLLQHVATSAIMDTILHLATVETPQLKTPFTQWFIENDFVNRLVQMVGPDFDSQVHDNVASLMCELIRRSTDNQQPSETSVYQTFTKSIDTEETCNSLLDCMLRQPVKESGVVAGISLLLTLLDRREPEGNKYKSDAVLSAISSRWSHLHNLLWHPPQQTYCPMLTTVGELKLPLGRTRLAIVRLTANILSHDHQGISEQISSLQTMPLIFDLCFEYVWNNFLHTQVEVSISALLTSQTYNCHIIQQLITNYKLVEKIVNIFKENQNIGLNKGRPGHMGHLTNISNKLLTHITNDPTIFKNLSGETREKWEEFVGSNLEDTNALNNNELVAGSTPSVVNIDSDFCINFEQDIVKKFGMVEDVFMKEDDNFPATNTSSDFNASEGVSAGSADMFEAMCSTNYNVQHSDQMFDAVNTDEKKIETNQLSIKIYSSDCPTMQQSEEDWANFGDAEMNLSDDLSIQKDPQMATDDLTSKSDSKMSVDNPTWTSESKMAADNPTWTSESKMAAEDVTEEWANFESMNTIDDQKEARNDGTSVDS